MKLKPVYKQLKFGAALVLQMEDQKQAQSLHVIDWLVLFQIS